MTPFHNEAEPLNYNPTALSTAEIVVTRNSK